MLRGRNQREGGGTGCCLDIHRRWSAGDAAKRTPKPTAKGRQGPTPSAPGRQLEGRDLPRSLLGGGAPTGGQKCPILTAHHGEGKKIGLEDTQAGETIPRLAASYEEGEAEHATKKELTTWRNRGGVRVPEKRTAGVAARK